MLNSHLTCKHCTYGFYIIFNTKDTLKKEEKEKILSSMYIEENRARN